MAIAAVVLLVLNRPDDSGSNVEIEGVEWQLAELQVDGALQPAVAGSGTRCSSMAPWQAVRVGATR